MKKLVVQVSMLAECGLNEAEIEEALCNVEQRNSRGFSGTYFL